MALIEVVIDEPDIRRTRLRTSFGGQAHARLGLAYAPVSFAPPRDPDEPSCPAARRRAGRGPPPADPDPTCGADPPFLDECGDPPWADDGPLSPDDDASQLPPNAEL